MPILGIMASQISGHLFAPSGAYDSIATANGTGSSGTITFSSIPSTYTHLQIRAITRLDYTGSVERQMLTRFNADTGANYAFHNLIGNGTIATTYSSASTTAMGGVDALCNAGAGATYTSAFTVAIIDILDYANTSKYKTIRSLTGWDANGDGQIWFDSGHWRSTSAVTSISILDTAYNITTNSQFALYGIKGA